MEHLLYCLTDTFENNKIEAYSILEALPFFSLKLEFKDHLGKAFMVSRIWPLKIVFLNEIFKNHKILYELVHTTGSSQHNYFI